MLSIYKEMILKELEVVPEEMMPKLCKIMFIAKKGRMTAWLDEEEKRSENGMEQTSGFY